MVTFRQGQSRHFSQKVYGSIPTQKFVYLDSMSPGPGPGPGPDPDPGPDPVETLFFDTHLVDTYIQTTTGGLTVSMYASQSDASVDLSAYSVSTPYPTYTVEIFRLAPEFEEVFSDELTLSTVEPDMILFSYLLPLTGPIYSPSIQISTIYADLEDISGERKFSVVIPAKSFDAVTDGGIVLPTGVDTWEDYFASQA